MLSHPAKFIIYNASYKSKSLSLPQGFVEVCTLGHMGGGNR